jgi:hypothetical protein
MMLHFSKVSASRSSQLKILFLRKKSHFIKCVTPNKFFKCDLKCKVPNDHDQIHKPLMYGFRYSYPPFANDFYSVSMPLTPNRKTSFIPKVMEPKSDVSDFG